MASLDIWEKNGLHRNTQVTPATFGGCADYPSEPCVNLPAMGAKNGVKDVFLQMDWMHGRAMATGGIDGSRLPFARPQAGGVDGGGESLRRHNIALHFDVGKQLPGPGAALHHSFTAAMLTATGWRKVDRTSTKPRSCARYARIPASTTQPYPVLSFKFGFSSVDDGNPFLGIPAHFAQNRLGSLPLRAFRPCLGADPSTPTGKPLTPIPRAYRASPTGRAATS